ncbi:9084_t:CDS:2, partial [Cetraspora pellucida]
MTKKDSGEYKATTIKQAVDAINRYLSKNNTIHEKELGKKKGSIALTAQQDIGQKIKVKLLEEILTNHSERKTAAQILQNANIPENTIMNITDHK